MAQSNFSALASPVLTNIGGYPYAGIYLANPPDGVFQWCEPSDNNVSWAGTQFGIGTIEVAPFAVPHNAVVNTVDLFLSQSYSATNAGSSQAQSLSFSFGFYSLNASSLSLISSFSQSTLCSVTGSTSSVSFQGVKNVQVSVGATPMVFAPGNYWIAIASSTSSAGNAIAAAISNVVYSYAGGLSNYKGVWGSSTFASEQARLGLGSVSVTSSVLPSAIALSDIAGGVGNTGVPVFNLKAYTA